jgi:hypothetical protein
VNRLVLLSALALLLRLAPAHALDTVTVHAPDFASLKQAIIDANDRPTDTLTTIFVFGEVGVAADAEPALPPIRARINIVGGSFREIDGGPDRLFKVDSTGILGIRDSDFVDWSSAINGPVLFENHGTLVLRRVDFASIIGLPFCGGKVCAPNSTAIILNGVTGHLTLDDVRFVDSGTAREFGPPTATNGILFNEGTAALHRTQVYLAHNRWEEPFTNTGFMRLRNSSFLVRNQLDLPRLPLLAAADSAAMESVNSVFDGFIGDWCLSAVSLGHNTVSARDCNWSAVGDAVGAPTGLIWRRNSADKNQFDLVPSAASSVIDSADAAWCPDGYEIRDGDGDGLATCDRGARELEPTRLAEGGINGFYFNPDEDGHYVYVQQTDFTTLVMWNTFDADGNQAWIYGTGKLEAGRSVMAEAYINRTGGLTPDGLLTDVDAEAWGELQIDMDSCARGIVAYRSVLPEFGSGQFPIERLAYVKQLGCVDPE